MLASRMLIETSAHRQTGKVLGGLAVVENSHDRTALIEGIPFLWNNPELAFRRELELLDLANSMMPVLPVEEVDVLWIGQMGKRISGTGMDTNLLNRNPYGYHPGERWRGRGASVNKVVCSRLQPSSHGNAHGVGLADFITERLAADIDMPATRLNSLTAFSPLLCSLPPVMKSDHDAILAAINTSPAVNRTDPALVMIPDTLRPGDAFISHTLLDSIDTSQFDFPEGKRPRDLEFDNNGYLVWPGHWLNNK